MTTRDDIQNDYFDWMFDLVCDGRYDESISYRKLLMHLHSTEFIWFIDMDENRAGDGIALRRRYSLLNGQSDLARYLTGPCSVLEMMIGLSIRCEENIMDDPDKGDRTGQWFWGMIANLGLGGMYDKMYDRQAVDDILTRLLYREYEPNGRGGLFTVKNYPRDLRGVEIWVQLCWMLNGIT